VNPYRPESSSTGLLSVEGPASSTLAPVPYKQPAMGHGERKTKPRGPESRLGVQSLPARRTLPGRTELSVGELTRQRASGKAPYFVVLGAVPRRMRIVPPCPIRRRPTGRLYIGAASRTVQGTVPPVRGVSSNGSEGRYCFENRWRFVPTGRDGSLPEADACNGLPERATGRCMRASDCLPVRWSA